MIHNKTQVDISFIDGQQCIYVSYNRVLGISTAMVNDASRHWDEHSLSAYHASPLPEGNTLPAMSTLL